MRRFPHSRIASIVLALVASLIGTVRAEPRSEEQRGRRLMEQGLRAYAAKNYAAAATAFERAYAADPQPTVLYAWAQAERLNGDCSAALVRYRAYLALELTAAQRAAAQVGLRRCAAADRADDGVGAESRPSRPDRRSSSSSSSGEARVHVVMSTELIGFDAADPDLTRQELRAASLADAPPAPVADSVVDLPFEDDMARTGDALAEGEVRRHGRRSWARDGLGAGLLTMGVVGVGVGAGFYVAARASEGEAGRATRESDYDRLINEGSYRRRVAGWSAAVGGAFVTAAFVRYVLVARRSSDRGARFAIGVDATGGPTLVVAGEF